MKPLLVDSSAWLDFFSKNPDLRIAAEITDAKKSKVLATCGMIQLEVVRGARNDAGYKDLMEEFQAMLWLSTENHHWDLAGEMGTKLARKGIHPPATDLLIAALTMNYQCLLLHRDRHFLQIAKHFPLSFPQVH